MLDNELNRVRVHFKDLGLIDYQLAWDYQTEIFQRTVDRKIKNRQHPEKHITTDNFLISCSHPHVYTLGKSGDQQNLLLGEKDLESKGISYYHINRGGDITYHGPGQLVIYPILDLDHFFTDVHKYLRYLEEAVIMTLRDYNLNGYRIDGLTGVWLGEENNPRKICALGVKMSRWVTMHGLAFNVNADLSYFEYIVPCGIRDKAVTSMQKELGDRVDEKEVLRALKGHLSTIFQIEFLDE